jgi:hypothetical protein
MKRVATIILNRNLPDETDRLCELLMKNDNQSTDVFVVDAGSDESLLSKYTTWHADWPEAKKHGLRYQRGMNYGLLKLYEEGKFYNYDAFLLLTNDTELSEGEPIIDTLMSVLDEHKRVGLLSPCSQKWGEKLLLEKRSTMYFWYIHNNANLLRREFIEDIMETENPNYMNFLYDGTNFRGYGTESEIIAKGYINDWASAITTKVWAEENESHLIENFELIKTESFEENFKMYISEGEKWMHKKYGFNSRWSMQMYVKLFYDQFFKYYPELSDYKI